MKSEPSSSSAASRSRSDYQCPLIPPDKERETAGHRAHPLVLAVRVLTHHERCGSLQAASPPVGVRLFFQNSSLASLPLPRAHSWQQGTREGEDKEEVKEEGRGTVKLPTEGHTPRIGNDAAA